MYINPGKFNEKIIINKELVTTDDSGFSKTELICLGSSMAYYEPKHGSERWVNRTQLFDASALFRFRPLPKDDVENGQIILCRKGKFEIVSVSEIDKSYIEVLAKAVDESESSTRT